VPIFAPSNTTFQHCHHVTQTELADEVSETKILTDFFVALDAQREADAIEKARRDAEEAVVRFFGQRWQSIWILEFLNVMSVFSLYPFGFLNNSPTKR
jgi:hypothetical protein